MALFSWRYMEFASRWDEAWRAGSLSLLHEALFNS